MEFLSSVLPWLQIALAVLITASVLLQQSDAGLGSAFGGGDSDNITRTRRGFEKVLFRSTVVFTILFVLVNVAALLI